jgi:hypothetical protein
MNDSTAYREGRQRTLAAAREVESAPAHPIVTTQAWPPMAVALLRAAVIGLVLAGVDFFAALQLDYTARDCAISAALIFFTNLAAALGMGSIDQANSRRG